MHLVKDFLIRSVSRFSAKDQFSSERGNGLASCNALAASMRLQRRNSCMWTHLYSFDDLMPSRKGSQNLFCSGAERWIDFFQKNSMRHACLPSPPGRVALLRLVQRLAFAAANTFRVKSTNSKKDVLSTLECIWLPTPPQNAIMRGG